MTAADLSFLNAIRVPTHFSLIDEKRESNASGFQQWRYDTVSQLKASSIDDWRKSDIEKTVVGVCLLEEAAHQVKSHSHKVPLS